MHFRSLEEFWAFYMNQHTKAWTRRWHFCGMVGAAAFLLASLLFRWWLLFFAPAFSYTMSFSSHLFIEGNSPHTSHHGHPFWSLLCNCKLFLLMLSGRLDREMKRLGKRPVLQVS